MSLQLINKIRKRIAADYLPKDVKFSTTSDKNIVIKNKIHEPKKIIHNWQIFGYGGSEFNIALYRPNGKILIYVYSYGDYDQSSWDDIQRTFMSKKVYHKEEIMDVSVLMQFGLITRGELMAWQDYLKSGYNKASMADDKKYLLRCLKAARTEVKSVQKKLSKLNKKQKA